MSNYGEWVSSSTGLYYHIKITRDQFMTIAHIDDQDAYDLDVNYLGELCWIGDDSEDLSDFLVEYLDVEADKDFFASERFFGKTDADINRFTSWLDKLATRLRAAVSAKLDEYSGKVSQLEEWGFDEIIRLDKDDFLSSFTLTVNSNCRLEVMLEDPNLLLEDVNWNGFFEFRDCYQQDHTSLNRATGSLLSVRPTKCLWRSSWVFNLDDIFNQLKDNTWVN